MAGTGRSSTKLARRAPALAVGAAMAGLLGAASLPATAQAPGSPLADARSFEEYGFQGEGEARLHDVDDRKGAVAPTPAQIARAEGLGATAPRFNAFGTPHVLRSDAGYLTGPRAGTAAEVARAFVRDNAELFRLDAAGVDTLELLNDSPLYDSPDLARVYRDGQPALNPDVPHVIRFRQSFGGLVAGLDGQLVVGVKGDGRVAWVTSSVTGDEDVRGAAALSETEALQAAAADVGVELGALTRATPDRGFEVYTSALVKDPQRVRTVALPTPTDGIRRAYEVTLLDTSLDEHGNPTAFISFVDAETGRVWQRSNKVEHVAEGVRGASSITSAPGATTRSTAPSTGRFSGTTAAGACGPRTDFAVTEGNGQITVTAAPIGVPEVQDTDIVINLYHLDALVASADVLNLPEALTYTPSGGVAAGLYQVEICPFTPQAAPPIAYEGTFEAGPGTVPGGADGTVQLPTWKVFPANPPFVAGQRPESFSSPDTRVLWCWDAARKPACTEQQRNSASRLPWDVNAPSAPSFTTDGNNASTAVSELNFVAPDTAVNRPVSPTREYEYPWGNKWFEGSCNPTTFGAAADPTGGSNDEAASTANLFVQHNRMHDWSYFLGFTENNYNLQKSNFGNTGPERENDPELGSSQAGRRTFNGRDNANQITLQDGIAPITNQYLWQPLAGAFYAPCVDGAYDQAVVAHEYGHAITNRMVGGPNGGTGPTQGQTESWSDLQFAAYFTEFAISSGAGVNPYVLGPYVTGDPVAGIRNYAMNASPLNYSDLDYDGNGLGSPHANGEIWSAANFDILSRLNAKYDGQFPSTDVALQEQCARGELAAAACPGNRRWNQLQYDSYLLQPSGVTMIDSRDAMLAADLLRFDGANQVELWDAFAARGLGASATSTGPADVDAVAGFDSPRRSDEAQVSFVGPAGAVGMEVFAGQYEARATPLRPTEAFVPGTYEFIAVAPGFGAQRFTQTFTPGQSVAVQVPLSRNLASSTNGAVASGDGVNVARLIDDTEETNWASLTSAGTASTGKGEGAQVEGRQVTVDLAGDAPVDVSEVRLSAALRGTAAGDADPGSQSRFSALRSFDLLACNAAAGADCSSSAGYTKIYGSGDDAFPAARPRPRAPDLTLRSFDVTDTMATHIRMVVRDNQCTGGPAYQAAANPDSDPAFNPDCDTLEVTPDRAVLSPPSSQVRAAELQVFSAPSGPAPRPGKGKGGGKP